MNQQTKDVYKAGIWLMITKGVINVAFALVVLAGIIWLVGCSTYGHQDDLPGPGGIDRAPQEEPWPESGPPDEYTCPPDGKTGPGWCNGKCDVTTECCPIMGSCKPLGCLDGYVCMNGTCKNVLKLIK